MMIDRCIKLLAAYYITVYKSSAGGGAATFIQCLLQRSDYNYIDCDEI
jgi:hypothetical protein